MEGFEKMYKYGSEYLTLLEERNDKILRLTDLMEELDILSEEYVFSPEIDIEFGEWTPEKETGLVDTMWIQDEIHKLNREIREIDRKLGPAKRRYQRLLQARS